MSDHEARKEPLPRMYHDLDGEGREGISLEPIAAFLRRYWKVIGLAVSLALVVSLAFAVVAFIRAPRNSFSRIEFRLEFQGIDRGEYPNGMPFSSAEVTATPILRAVYDRNQLEQYLPFDTFKNSVYVLESSPELMLLDLDYQARLSNNNLNPVERERIQQEYLSKRENQTRSGYSINLQRVNSMTAVMPSTLVAKVLNEILNGWAEDAVARGVLKFQAGVYSTRVIDTDGIRSENDLVAADQMRALTQRVIQNIDVVSQLPGAAVVRSNGTGMSLSELRVSVSNLIEFKIQPLIAAIVAGGSYGSGTDAVSYLESKLTEARQAEREASDKSDTMRVALGAYVQQPSVQGAGAGRGGAETMVDPRTGVSSSPAIIQLGESFLDRLIAMSSQGGDAAFRQEVTRNVIQEGLAAASFRIEAAYYEDLLTRVRSGRTSRAALSAAEIDEDREEILKRIIDIVTQLNAIYESVSAQNLGAGNLYVVSGPPDSITQRAVQPVALLGYAFLAVLIVTGCTLAVCGVHWKLQREARAHAAEALERELV